MTIDGEEPVGEEVLAGGNVGRVVRVGDTVRREAGPWTPAVHDLLRHLRARGFDLAPEPFGIDERGREVLEHLEGDTVGGTHPWPSWVWTDELLEDVGTALRRYHDAVADHRPAGPLRSRVGESTLGPGHVLCHNDLAPYNVVVRAGRLAGVIDWDIVAAAPPDWDLAFVAWHWVPLHAPALSAGLGAPDLDTRGRRLAHLADAYGTTLTDRFVDLVVERIAASRDGIHRLAAAGDPPFVRMAAEGHADEMQAAIDWVHANRDALA